MKKNLFIGIDLGATTLKVGAFNVETGKCVALESAETAMITAKKDWAEYEPANYRNMLAKTLQTVCGAVDKQCIGGVAVSSQGQACVLLDGEGRPTRNMFVWLDSRAAEQAEKFRKLTGEKISSFASAAKWLWVSENEPDVWSQTSAIMMLPEYVTFLLTEKRVVDRDTAASTRCLSKTRLEYEPEWLAACGVTEQMLGRPAAPCDMIGPVTGKAQNEFGIPEGTLVVAGTNDQLAGAIGAGNDSPGIISGTAGTAMALIANLGKKAPERGIACSRHEYPIPGQHYTLTFGKTGAALFTWFRNNFAPGSDYPGLIAEAMRVPEGCDSMICIPHFQGVATPSFRDDVRGGFLNVSMNHTLAHFARSVLESVCFSALDNFELVHPLVGMPERVLLLGGASKSDAWMQMMCDILGTPVELPAQSESATLGAALIAATGAGFHKDLPSAIRAGVSFKKRFEPDLNRREKYLVAYRFYRDAMEKLYKGAL